MFDSENTAAARGLARVSGNRFTLYGERAYAPNNGTPRLSASKVGGISSDVTLFNYIAGNGVSSAPITYGLADSRNTFIGDGTFREYARLYGYGLDGAGNVSSLQTASILHAAANNTTGLKGTALLNNGIYDIPIDSHAVVFAYKLENQYATDGVTVLSKNIDVTAKDLSAVDTVALREAKQKASGYDFQYVLSRDGKRVAAILLDSEYVEGDDNSVYAVIQSYTNVNIGGKKEIEIVALVDGDTTPKIYQTDQTKRNIDNIKDDLDFVMGSGNGAKSLTHGAILSPVKLSLNNAGKVKNVMIALEETDDSSYNVPDFRVVYYYGATYGAIGNYKIGNLQARTDSRPGVGSGDRIELIRGTGRHVAVASNVVVYHAKWNDATQKYDYFVSSLSDIERGAGIFAYDTKGSKFTDIDGKATIVIWVDYLDGIDKVDASRAASYTWAQDSVWYDSNGDLHRYLWNVKP